MLRYKADKNVYSIYPIYNINSFFSLKINESIISFFQNKVVEYSSSLSQGRRAFEEKKYYSRSTLQKVQLKSIILFYSNQTKFVLWEIIIY